MNGQSDFFDGVAVEPIVQPPRDHAVDDVLAMPLSRRFEMFHRLNPQVLERIVNMGLALKSKGFKMAAVKMIVERLRWEVYFSTLGEEEYKVNNSFTAYYSRLAVAVCPSLDGFFEIRSQRSRWDPGGEIVLDAKRRNPEWK